MKIKHRLLPNEHIQHPDKKIDEWLRVPHTAGEYAATLRIGQSDMYDVTDAENDFDENQLLEDLDAKKQVITEYDTDKLKEVAKPFND